jgi:hypothetical protein
MVVGILLGTGIAIALMSVLANGALLRRVGVTSSCGVVRTSAGAELEACHAGWLNGFPSLSSHGCTTVGRMGRDELWSCPVR